MAIVFPIKRDYMNNTSEIEGFFSDEELPKSD
jgi:hypothetical protein